MAKYLPGFWFGLETLAFSVGCKRIRGAEGASPQTVGPGRSGMPCPRTTLSWRWAIASGARTVSVSSESGRVPDPGLVDAVRTSISMAISMAICMP